MNLIGAMFYGFCDGYFGRDSYNDKRVEAVGFDWIVVREDVWTGKESKAIPDIVWLEGGIEKHADRIKKWMIKPPSED